MPRHHLEHLIELVRGEGGARRARFFAPDFLPVELENVVGFGAQERDLFLRKTVRKKDIALVVEGLELLGGKLHGRAPLDKRCGRCSALVACAYFRERAGKGQIKCAPDSAMARCSKKPKASSITGTAKGIRAASATERVTKGTIQSAASRVFSHGTKPRFMPVAARKAMAGASSIRS